VNEQNLVPIVSDSGISLLWRIIGPATPKETFSNLVAARLRGQCRAFSGDPRWLRLKALGRTHISDGQILTFLEVDCDQVRTTRAAGDEAIPQPPPAQ
jgi:hypothetical protein